MHDNSREYTPELCDERHGRIELDLRHIEDKVERVELCTVKLTQIIERHDKQIEAQESRIGRLERRTGVQLERMVWYALSAALGALAASATEYFLI